MDMLGQVLRLHPSPPWFGSAGLKRDLWLLLSGQMNRLSGIYCRVKTSHSPHAHQKEHMKPSIPQTVGSLVLPIAALSYY